MNTNFLKRNASTILTCLSGVGLIATTMLSAHASLKAKDILDEEKPENGLETLKIIAPVFAPTILTGSATLLCMFSANALNKQQQASLISAYGLIDQSYRKYQNKVKDIYGEEAHQEIMDAIVKEEVEDICLSASGGFYSCCLELEEENTSKPVLFYDTFGKRYFETTIEKVMAAEYHINRNYTLGGLIMLNEFYEFLGLPPTDYGNEVGWCIGDNEIYWIDFDHRKITLDDGLEVYAIDTIFPPNQEWKELY